MHAGDRGWSYQCPHPEPRNRRCRRPLSPSLHPACLSAACSWWWLHAQCPVPSSRGSMCAGRRQWSVVGGRQGSGSRRGGRPQTRPASRSGVMCISSKPQQLLPCGVTGPRGCHARARAVCSAAKWAPFGGWGKTKRGSGNLGRRSRQMWEKMVQGHQATGGREETQGTADKGQTALMGMASTG
jgi:hypothetical protein